MERGTVNQKQNFSKKEVNDHVEEQRTCDKEAKWAMQRPESQRRWHFRRRRSSSMKIA